MSVPSGPFQIINQGEIASTTSGSCSSITFSPEGNGGAFDSWVFTPVPDGSGSGFKNVATGMWATAVEGLVAACPQPTAWNVVNNQDGSYLVNLPDSKIIWAVRPDGKLGLGSAQAQLTDANRFAFGQ